MTIIGYARISDKTQEIGTQVEQLKKEGCDRIVQEVVSGVNKDKELNRLVKDLEEGDVLMATRVDRLGRSAIQILSLAEQLREKGVHLKILDLGIDTRTLAGQLVLGVMSQIAEFEREQSKIKQKNGIALARSKGRHLGRKSSWSKAAMQNALDEYAKGEKTMNEISDIYGISRSTIYHYIKLSGLKRELIDVEKIPEE